MAETFRPKRSSDLTWGKYDYPVTHTQYLTLDGIWYMLSALPKAFDSDSLPAGGYYSQNPTTGAVILGLHGKSLTVHRSGRVTSNQ